MSTTSSATDLQMSYLKLLVTQMQNQNPLDPMDSNQMTSQLAQFSQLEQLENLNSSFSTVLQSTQRSYASSLVGKEVSYEAEASDGTAETVTGSVSGVVFTDDGIRLAVGDKTIGLDEVTIIQE
ncbi:MAG: flagellar hook assembly protein FlgD [Solirubrobacterales bacterium]